MSNKKRLLSLGEEISNSITHGIGAGLSVAALVLLIIRAVKYSDAFGVVSASIFGGALVLLYSMSTFCHAFARTKSKDVFRILDHVTIFILISGTYTPYLLVSMRQVSPAVAWTMFGIVWGLTAVGVTFDSIMLDRFHKLELVLFVYMGWCIIAAARTLVTTLAPVGIAFLLVGGICYTVGIIFFLMNKVPYMHTIWHLFVLAGSVLHFFSVYFYVYK